MESIRPSSYVLPEGNWLTILDCLCERFAAITREQWLSRMERQRVFFEDGTPVTMDDQFKRGLRISYYREIPNEKEIPFYESILFMDEHLLVVDKPHFLPVSPVGEYVQQTLQARLIKALKNPELQPIHRIDRHTAGLVLFSLRKETRSAYQALFRTHAIEKTYEAIAPPMIGVSLPHTRSTRIERGDPFYLSQEVEGEINAITIIDVLSKKDDRWHYQLKPVSGKKHQLRLHMAALGAPLVNDPLYPTIRHEEADNYTRPLQLLASEVRFIDPITNDARYFKTQLRLQE